MSEASLLHHMEQLAQKECDELLSKARLDAEAILQATQREVDREREKAEKAKQAKAVLAKRKNAAARVALELRLRQECQTVVSMAQGEALVKAKAILWTELDRWIEKPLYEDALKDILIESAQAFSQDPPQTLRIRVSSKDKRRVQGLLKKYNIPYEMDTDESIAGGLVMMSQDGKSLADGRIQTRLIKVWEESVSDIRRILFEERPGDKEEEEKKDDASSGSQETSTQDVSAEKLD